MAVTREELLAEGEANVNAAVDELRRVASMTHSELVCETIRTAIVTIEAHRHTCKIISEFFPAIEPIRNDDLASTLRLRLRLVDALREWKSKNEHGD